MYKENIKEIDDLIRFCKESKISYVAALENIRAFFYNIDNLVILNPEKEKITGEILNKTSELFELLKANRLNLT